MHTKLAIAAIAMLAFTAPAFATGTCETRVTDGGVTIVETQTPYLAYAGSNAGSKPVFYGDVGCGPAGTCVMPSLSDLGSSSVKPAIRIDTSEVENEDIVEHRTVIYNPFYPDYSQHQYLYTGSYSLGGC